MATEARVSQRRFTETRCCCEKDASREEGHSMRGYFGYEDDHMRYFGEKLIIEEQDSDFWFAYEVEEQLKRLGVAKDDIAALWYKDLEYEEIEIGLQTLGLLRGLVELYVVHEGNDEGFPEIGWMDVGPNQHGERRYMMLLLVKMRLRCWGFRSGRCCCWVEVGVEVGDAHY
ncbi:hypothetical protein PIB30_074125 [Stylosanthes scabra]|uniref:Uncharacterized protein n=1 Tax=Stylosanthes scabra TaxID=79078 RepID=A0ABU6UQ85_9FABA|nr:hypothetical protein [Stylosanthes scabra]